MGTAGIQSGANRLIHENEGWQKTISSQSAELPELEKMLTAEEQATDAYPAEKACFREMLDTLKTELSQLDQLLLDQQERLRQVLPGMGWYDFDAICYQDILRNRIREAQQHFVDLKCNFLRFWSGAL